MPGSARLLDDYAIDSAQVRAVERSAKRVRRQRLRDVDSLVRDLQARCWRIVRGRSWAPPALPEVALHVLKHASAPRPDTGIMATLIERDRALANTVCWAALAQCERSGTETNGSLTSAIEVLGIRRSAAAVLGAAQRSTLYQGDPQRALDDLWNGTVSVAVAAGAINQLRRRSNDAAFLLGIVQDAGRAALLPVVGQLLAEMGRRANIEVVAPPVLHLLHARIGAEIAQRWGMPRGIVTTIAHHHERAVPDAHYNAVAVLRLATLVHQRMLLAKGPLELDSTVLGHTLVTKLCISRDRLAQMLAFHASAVSSMHNLPGWE